MLLEARRTNPADRLQNSEVRARREGGWMIPSLTRSQVREIDRRAIAEYGLPGPVLMENAGRGAARHLLEIGVAGKVVVCCGKGNNGGDGFVLARWLDLARVPVEVLLFADSAEVSQDARGFLQVLERAGVPLAANVPPKELAARSNGAQWIVDGLVGTGLAGPPQPALAEAIEQINAAGCKVFSLDLPSGLDCDTGEPLGPTVRADHTATFVAWKRGFLAPVTYHWIGQVEVVEIGVPRRLLREFLPDLD